MTDPFESAWLKWAWAVKNAEVLVDSIAGFASDFGNRELDYQLVNYYDAKRHCVVLVVAEGTDPFPVLWGVLLGDAVHDYRCCLDHLAWALYKRGRTPDLPEWQERQVGFPIHGTRDGFNKALDSKLPGVRRADRAIVRRYQPYARGERRGAPRHVFTVLQELSNDDKHRVIQPVVAIPQQIDFLYTEATDCTVGRIGPGGFGGTLEPGAKLARFYVKKTGPKPRIDTQPQFHLVPAIHERLTLADFLARTMVATRSFLQEFAEPPPSAVSLLGAPIPPR